MDTNKKSTPASELTTTLHLGVRSTADSSPTALIDKYLSESSKEDAAVLQALLDGDGEKAMIIIHRGASRGARFLITSDGVTIGRAPASDIFLDDVTVSRSHGTITKEGRAFIYKDGGSLNGSYINNEEVSTHHLVSGDELQIGKFHMLFIGAANKGRSE